MQQRLFCSTHIVSFHLCCVARGKIFSLRCFSRAQPIDYAANCARLIPLHSSAQRPAGTASGDNGNALALADVANKGVLDGGVTTVGKSYSQLIAQVGTAGAHANTALDAQQSILDQATAAQQSLSGVNMDEEAANLLRFQQSYAAAAQVINAANTIFDSLMSAVRG